MGKRVLVLCCCSNRKLAGESEGYRRDYSPQVLLGNRGEELLQARAQVRQLMLDGAQSTDGTPLIELPHNGELKNGPDFGGKARARYMPAQFRYRGRFYTEIDRKETGVLGENTHHWLIISALYGLVGPKESIQRYSCHTKDSKEITKIWSSGLLTSLLLHFIRVFEVSVVVDLLADETYRELINWNKLVNHRVKVLRAYGDQNAGPGLLPALGNFARDTLSNLQADELMSIDPYRTFRTDFEDVALALEEEDLPWPLPPCR